MKVLKYKTHLPIPTAIPLEESMYDSPPPRFAKSAISISFSLFVL